MIRPSDDHSTPDPLPLLPPGRTNTVKRRRRSAISPNPGMLMLFALVLAFANNNGYFAGRAAAKESRAHVFADVLACEMRLHIFKTQHGLAIQAHKNVADHDSCFVRWAGRFDFQHHDRAIRLAIQRLHEILREANRLQTNTEVAARDASFLQQSVDHTIHRGYRQSQRAAWRELRCGDADNASVAIDHRATNSRSRQRHVETHIRRQWRAAPDAPFLHYQADKSQRRNGSAGAR